MTLVVGTAGHIDHGKTTLLRAITGIDADRLPEERRRGMTIDIGYAHMTLPDGGAVDFVDVPGHDRLVGNMLVGAGEIDAAMLVVAADDGPRAQTLEHLALLDALEVPLALVVVTKIDAVPRERVDGVVGQIGELLATTARADSPVVPASAASGEGLDAVRGALVALAGRHRPSGRPATLAIDRAFTVKGRGAVVTGTLRGGPLATGERLRLLPGDREVRIREIQVHGSSVERVDGGGRTALNLVGIDVGDLRRGMVLTVDSDIVATDRVLVAFGGRVADRMRGRVHIHTASVDGVVGHSGRDALALDDGRDAGIVRLSEPVAVRAGDRFVIRRGATLPPLGGVVLDADPPRGISRRRQTNERVSALARAASEARLDLHGSVDGRLASDVAALAQAAALEAVQPSASLTSARTAVAAALRRGITVRRDEAAGLASRVVDELVAAGRLVRDGDVVRRPGTTEPRGDPKLAGAMDRLEAALATPTPPPLTDAARAVGCPPEGIRALEKAARIVVLEPELAYAMSTYRELAARALSMAAAGPLTPAAFRDATGTSRKYVMAILEDLDRRAILRRTPDGHVPGPKAPTPATR
ncbi:MAG TPA: selenocysteine-specific translation elongation factor [Candidatus Limnocylindrales bacterium]|nr:selenocysteine-specific translation elongation factor [Candidatus Limnocylindrales bacterium]